MQKSNKAAKKRLQVQKLRNWVEESRAIYEINKSVTSTLKLPQLLKLITSKACQIMRAEGSSLRLLAKNKKELILQAHSGLNKRSHLRKGNIKVGESIAGRVVKENKCYIIDDLLSEERYKDTEIVRRENFRSLLSVPLVEKGRAFGVVSIYSGKSAHFNQDDARLLEMFASQAAVAISNAWLYKRAQENYLGAIRFLANALDAKDSYTANHSEKVAVIALEIAYQMKMSESQKDIIEHAGYLHDLGKVCVDINTLRKEGALSELEWMSIQKHPEVAAQILNNVDSLSNLAPIILHHHARYAGGGYPDKDIKHDKIPIGSRILAVADAYEAMISHRPYREALSMQEACSELQRCAGTQFDPTVVEAFLKAQQTAAN